MGQLRPPKPPGGSVFTPPPDSDPEALPQRVQSVQDVVTGQSIPAQVPQTLTAATSAYSSLSQAPQIVKIPAGPKTLRLPTGTAEPAQPIRMPPLANTRIIRLPSGQTIRVPASAQTIRLPSGQMLRLPPRQTTQAIRLPTGQSAQAVRLASGQSTQTIRLPSGQSKHIIRVPPGQLGQTIRLPSGQVLRLPASLVSKSAGGATAPTVIRMVSTTAAASPVVQSSNLGTIPQTTAVSMVTPATNTGSGTKAGVTIPNGNIPAGATVIRRQGKTYILQNSPVSAPSQVEQGTSLTNQYLGNFLGAGNKTAIQVVTQTGVTGSNVKFLSGNVGQLGLSEHSPSPSPPPLALSNMLGRPTSSSTPPPLTSATNGVVKTQLTSKDVSRLWSNEDLKLKTIASNNRIVSKFFIIHLMPYQ